jgi:hypothetical protein
VPGTSSFDLASALAIIQASTHPDPEGWRALTESAYRASIARAEGMAATNRARAAARRAAVVAAVAHVRGALPSTAHGVATVLEKRIATAVRRGDLSSTLGGTDAPGLRAIRRAWAEANELVVPVMARNPAGLASTHSSVSPTTGPL